MANSPILDIPLLTSNQAAKEVTINNAISFLEKSTNAAQDIDFTAGDVTLPLVDLQRFFFFKFINVGAAQDLTIPATTRIFAVDNTENAYAITIVRDADSVVVASGASCLVAVDDDSVLFLANSAVGGSQPFTSLSDAPSSYSGQAGLFIRVNATEDGLEFTTGSSSLDFTDLDDTPSAYTGEAGSVIVVNATEDGLEFAAAGNVTNFVDLGDVPTDYTDQAGYYVRVNETEDGLEFGAAGELLSNFIQLLDAPSSYSGQAGKVVTVADEENGLVFADASGGGGASTFLGLTDSPEDYSGNEGLFVRVNGDGDALIFAAAGDSLSDFVQLGDVPEDYTGAGGKFVKVVSGEDGLEFSTAAFTDLSDVPDDYTGLGGFLLRVTGGEDGLEAVSAATATVLGINTQADDYTLVVGDAGKYVRMNKGSAVNLTVPANSSVAFPIGTSIPIRAVGIGQVTIVEDSGVTVNTAETLLLRKQNSGASLIKVGTNEWDLVGDLELA